MELNKYLRTIINSKIRPIFIKDKCEVCEKEEGLHLHHVKLFSEILNETLFDLKLPEKDTDDYNEKELQMIVDVILGRHIQIKYLTLCNKCHQLAHEEEKKDLCVNDKHKQYYETLKHQQEIHQETHIDETLIPYLQSVKEKKLFKKDQEILKHIFLKSGFKNRTSGINVLNNILKNKEIPYEITIGKRKSYRDENGKVKKDKSHWIITTVNQESKS